MTTTTTPTSPPGPGREPFVSTLGVSEFVLLGQVGFHPVGVAFGCSVYLPGDDPQAADGADDPQRRGELVGTTQELYAARQRAMTRLAEEAAALDADGVVGIDLRVSPTTGAGTDPRVAHVTALGTAVRAQGPPPTGSWRTHWGTPFTCTLSGSDLWTLLRAGYAPLGVALGASTFSTPPGRRRSRGEGPDGAELADHTQTVHAARVRALDRLREDAAELRADGVVDVRVTGLSDPLRPGPVDVVAVGTAVRALGGPPPAPVEPTYVLPLAGR